MNKCNVTTYSEKKYLVVKVIISRIPHITLKVHLQIHK